MKKFIVLALFTITCFCELHAIKVSFNTRNGEEEIIIIIDTNTLTFTTNMSGPSFDYKLKDLYIQGDCILGHFKNRDLVINQDDVMHFFFITVSNSNTPSYFTLSKKDETREWYNFYSKNKKEFVSAYNRLYAHLKNTGKTNKGSSNTQVSNQSKQTKRQENKSQGQIIQKKEPTKPKSVYETELPYRFEVPYDLKLKADDINKGEYSGLATYEGGVVGIILHTKTGKYPEDVGILNYNVEISPMNGESADWLTIKGVLHPNMMGINIEPNYTSRSRAANLYFKINGKIYGRIFILQLAKGSKVNW